MMLLCAVSFFAVTTLTGLRTDQPMIDAVDDWLRNSFSLAAGSLCVLRAILIRGERAAWATLGVGLVCYGAGTIYFYAVVVHLNPQPYPSLADLGWLAFYPAIYIMVILLLRKRVSTFHPSVWLDALVGGLGVAALASGLGATSIGKVSGGSLTTAVVNLAYPLADLVLFVLVVSVFGVFGWRPERVWWLLGGALVGFVIADTIFLLRAAAGTYAPGGPVEALWALALLLPAFAAWQRQPQAAAAHMTGWAVLTIPAVFTLTSLGLLVVGATAVLPTVAVALATATVLCALVRGGMTFAEVRQLAETKLQARTDELTGLANRRGFIERLTQAERDCQNGQSFGLLVLDLDRFKEINDCLGHLLGDELLVLVGARITTVMRSSDLIARLGGDEFAVLVEDVDASKANHIAERVRAALSAPFDVSGVTLHVDVSIGVAIYPDDADGGRGLLQRADVAMYAAKTGRTGVEYYRPAVDVHTLVRLDTIEALRAAFGQGQLCVHYQLKVNLRTGASDAVEALVRWQHPTRGLLQPDAFVPLAEQAGLMHPLTLEVLELALSQCHRWWDLGLQVSVAVNLSASNLLDSGFPAQVSGLLAAHRLPPQALELEITETTLMLDRVRSAAVLGELRKLGIRIAVDDYGTGYSSLAYLRELPVDELKLDKSFVLHLDEDPLAAAIVHSTVGLAHSLGLLIVVEGVESETAMRQLRDFGCDFAQGHHLGGPQPAEQVTNLLRRHIAQRPAYEQDAPVRIGHR